MTVRVSKAHWAMRLLFSSVPGMEPRWLYRNARRAGEERGLRGLRVADAAAPVPHRAVVGADVDLDRRAGGHGDGRLERQHALIPAGAAPLIRQDHAVGERGAESEGEPLHDAVAGGAGTGR